MDKQTKFDERCAAVGIDSAHGDYISFYGLTGAAARALLESGAADPDDCQNSAPSFEDITKFLETYPKFTGHGYIIGPKRSDERITIEGVETKEKLTSEEIESFAELFHRADEFSMSDSGSRCWYD